MFFAPYSCNRRDLELRVLNACCVKLHGLTAVIEAPPFNNAPHSRLAWISNLLWHTATYRRNWKSFVCDSQTAGQHLLMLQQSCMSIRPSCAAT